MRVVVDTDVFISAALKEIRHPARPRTLPPLKAELDPTR